MTLKEVPVTLTRPENKGVSDRAAGNLKPWELDPELAQLKIAELMIGKMGTPSILEKPFAVRYAIFNALNHDIENPTGYDTSLRLAVYRQYASQSINQDGIYFKNFWAYMMRPKYVIQGGNMIGQPAEEKQSIIGRAIGWFTGKGKTEQQPNHGG